MGDGWYTKPGARGELIVEWRDDAWYLADRSENGAVKCILPDDVSPSPSESPHQIDVRVSKCMRADGSGPSYLFLDRTDGAGSTAGTTPDSRGGSTSSNQNTTQKCKQTNTGHSSDRTMLDKIAREKIGDEEFTMSEEDTDSVVGQAKKRARNQGRDPAIDPTFQRSNDNDEDTDD